MKTNYFILSPVKCSAASASLAASANKKQNSQFERINSYYSSFKAIGGLNEIIGSSYCFATRLAEALLRFLGNRKHNLRDNALPDSFYHRCLKTLRADGACRYPESDGILLIAIKQTMHILRAAGVVKMETNKTFAVPINTEESSFYYMLFDAFWNRVEWEDIFPQDPEAAAALQSDKIILMDILYNQKGRVDINTLANEFFDLTGFAEKNDIMAVSFLDFYLLFWLKNFNIINYYDIDGGIFLELTASGKRLISFICE